jgi:hypothetical protein
MQSFAAIGFGALTQGRAGPSESETSANAAGSSSVTPASSAPSVAVLGCGLCCPPLIDYLSFHRISILVASRTVSKGESLRATLPPAQQQYVHTAAYDIASDDEAAGSPALRQLLDRPGIRIVISMLPYIHHVQAAKVAIALKKVAQSKDTRVAAACRR